jgi:type VI secretion system protein ImpG
MFGSNATLNSLFLRELEALDAFALERETEGALTIGATDPDVRRLLEALAFFSARTQAAAVESTATAVRRIAAGTLDDLLEPAPAALLVECDTSQLAEPVTLPRGPLLKVAEAERVGLFSTVSRTILRPIGVERVRMDERGGRRVVRISLKARVQQHGPVCLAFHVRRLSDYRASLVLYDALERHRVRGFVTSRDSQQGLDEPIACAVRFDAKLTDAVDDLEDRGPFARLRSLFHFPEQELYVCFDVPALGFGWQQLNLCLELDAEFPDDIALTNDSFRLHVVPTLNSWVEGAEPIVYRGLTELVPIRRATTAFEQVEPAGVRAVYRATPNGLRPLLPAALAQKGDCYEVENNGAQLRLTIENAFENPCRILPELCWQQPRLWASGAIRPVIGAYSRHLPNVTFRSLGSMRAAKPSALQHDVGRCLDVLSYRMQSRLTRDMLYRMLEILGVGEEGPFRGASTLVHSLDSREEPHAEAGMLGIRIVYDLALRERSPDDAALTRRLSKRIGELLDAWTELPVQVDSCVVSHTGRPNRLQLGAA